MVKNGVEVGGGRGERYRKIIKRNRIKIGFLNGSCDDMLNRSFGFWPTLPMYTLKPEHCD